ncbi:MAG: phage scaffolding protein [Bacillota bacterium]|nr:phage scaffolding protein [Bacillota bacterium]
MLDWLKTILGGSYTEEIDRQVSAQIGKDFVSRADFNTVNETKKTLETTVKDRDVQLEELKKVDAAGLHAKIRELQETNKNTRADFDRRLAELNLNAALDAAIAKEKGKNPKAIKALIDKEALKLKDDGTLEGLDMEALKTSDPYLFEIETNSVMGTGGAKGNTFLSDGAEPEKMSMSQYRAWRDKQK